MLPVKEQILIGARVRRVGSRLGRLGRLFDAFRLGRIAHQQAPLRVGHPQRQSGRIAARVRDKLRQHTDRGEVERPLPERLAVLFKRDPRAGKLAACVYGQISRLPVQLETHSHVDRRAFDHSHFLVGHEILGEGLFLIRRKPREIRLVVGKAPCHQFDIRAVLIRQVAIPCLPKVAAAPGPLFLAGRNMVIRHMQDAGAPSVVVAAHKVVIRMIRHIGGRHRDIFIAGDIDACGVILLIINARRNREA